MGTRTVAVVTNSQVHCTVFISVTTTTTTETKETTTTTTTYVQTTATSFQSEGKLKTFNPRHTVKI